MAELEVIDFEKVAKKLLLSQYHKPNFISLMRIIAKIFNDIQVNNFLLQSKFWLIDATGEQLDFLGGIWDVERGVSTDTKYRIAIYNKIAKTISGTIPEIKNFMKISGATFSIYSPEYPAKFRIRTDANVTFEQLTDLSPSGVTGFLAGRLTTACGGSILMGNGEILIHVSPTIVIPETIEGALYGASLYGTGLYGG